MKRTTYLIIIASITVLCIICGAYFNLRHTGSSIRRAKRAIKNSFKYNYDYDYDYDDNYTDLKFDDYDDDDDFDDDDLGDETTAFDSKELEPFHTVSIEGDILAIEFVRGSSYSISAKYNNSRLRPEYALKNGKLYIEQNLAKKKMVGNNDCKVKITVPFPVTLDSMDIDINVGAVEIHGFGADSVSIHTDVGAVEITKFDFRDMYIKSEVGAVSVELIDEVKDYEMNLSSNLGAIQVENRSVKRKFSQKGTNGKSLRIKTNIGGVEVK